MLLRQAYDQYLADMQIIRRDRTIDRAEQVLGEFVAFAGDRPLDQINPRLVNEYLADRKKLAHNSNRTLWNKATRVLALLRHHGFPLKMEKPRYVKQEPLMYDPADLARFFAACNRRQLCLYRLLLSTGLRRDEAKYLEWTDIRGNILKVTAHPPQFLPKDSEERIVPLPESIQNLLKALPRRPGNLVFPTRNGTPNHHMLVQCKRIARIAGLDRDEWSLHGFRRTYATTLLQSGVDLKTVQKLMGHTRLESTMRYLVAIDAKRMIGRVSEIFG